MGQKKKSGMIRSTEKVLRSGGQLVQKQIRHSMTTDPPKVHGGLLEGLDIKTLGITLTAVTCVGGLFLKCDERSNKRAENLGKVIDKASGAADKRIDEIKEDLGKRIDETSKSTNKRIDEIKEDLVKRIDKTRAATKKLFDETKAEVSKVSDGITQILLLLAKTSPNVEKTTPSNTASAKEK